MPEQRWIVQPGDTLHQIAVKTGVSLAALLAANPGVDPENLQVGRVLIVPALDGNSPEPPPCPGGVYWVVAPGDTLYSIAQATGAYVEDILAVNPGLDPNNLQVGQRICVPPPPLVPPEVPPCPSGIFWVVEPGDTLYKIAQATGFTVEELLAVNPGLDPEHLQPRTNICLPRGGLVRRAGLDEGVEG
ncbi:MAG TPA: LysM peptidoglycan-binding domain-containing protein [Firmicutes bacterium]|nr:LysM peptidoglycan-binding domain-containing protein [Bacillota bacterium]